MVFVPPLPEGSTHLQPQCGTCLFFSDWPLFRCKAISLEDYSVFSEATGLFHMKSAINGDLPLRISFHAFRVYSLVLPTFLFLFPCLAWPVPLSPAEHTTMPKPFVSSREIAFSFQHRGSTAEHFWSLLKVFVLWVVDNEECGKRWFGEARAGPICSGNDNQ